MFGIDKEAIINSLDNLFKLLVLAITKIIDAANGKIRNLPFGIIIPAFK